MTVRYADPAVLPPGSPARERPRIRMAQQPPTPVQAHPAAGRATHARGLRPSRRPAPGVIQRCGGHPCDCPSEGHSEDGLIARASSSRVPAVPAAAPVPPIVSAVVRSAGAPLDEATRSSMEFAFGHDFSRVRIHTDEKASSSARAVDALAYTAGRDVVFAAGQYAPGTDQGRRLLAHELAHVVQQGTEQPVPRAVSSPDDALECAADHVAQAVMGGWRAGPVGGDPAVASPRLHRTVGRLGCPANVASAPADPGAELADIDGQAQNMAQTLGTLLAADAVEVQGGMPPSPSATLQAFIDHFGLPPAEGAGFLNRLTGVIRPSLEVATSEEVQILSRRFALVARFFGDPVHYACGAGAVDAGGGCADDCGSATFDAFSCRGISGVGLCSFFWTDFADNTTRAAVLIHEAFHIIWGPSTPSQPGEIGDETLRGPGRNFDVAGCYESLVGEVFGTDPTAECPPVP